MVSVPGLKVTVDLSSMDHDGLDTSFPTAAPKPTSPELQTIYCACQTDYCNCGSTSGVTEAAARKVYKHLGFPDGRATMLAEGHRECALHIWGTHNLSTKEILSWLADYNPINIEWINDASCNVIFADANTVLRVIVDFAEPFDRRVALTAAAALASLLDKKDEDNGRNNTNDEGDDTSRGCDDISEVTKNSDASESIGEQPSLHLSSETLDSIEDFSQYLPPSGRWYKALSVPAKTVSLFLRFAHKSDVKLPGAERRSLYYRRYGNPNYGGMAGILSRSYRRRLRVARSRAGTDPNGSLRHVRILSNDFAEAVARAYEDPDAVASPKKWPTMSPFGFVGSDPIGPMPRRQLIVYDNLEDNEAPDTKPALNTVSNGYLTYAGHRREAADFSTPKSPRQPRKWPRRDRGPAPNRWLANGNVDDDDYYSFSPPSLDNINVVDLREPWSAESSKPFVFSGKKTNSRRVVHRSHLADRITTITLMPDAEPPSLSPSPVRADEGPHTEDENAYRTRRLLASMSMVADMEERSTNSRSLANRLGSQPHRKHSTKTSLPPRHRNRDVWQRLG
ncbi:hypothetical protein P879_09549 [Paragonimus westermani]|uniref:Nuclear cap-binding protein subunit 3 n=1 Tax=Paragonimus westermani TaxID=34504 RepID=A0A8T0D1N1_9TREM|nr:hypothetical protein P879_09549 [Paragonimus westermani]